VLHVTGSPADLGLQPDTVRPSKRRNYSIAVRWRLLRSPLDGPSIPGYNAAMSVESALSSLRSEPRFIRNVVHWAQIPARPARFEAFPSELDARLPAALRARGITALYTHQALAAAAALRGEHVAVITPAASGKTLCYNLPVLHRLLLDPRAKALYLFPTKALAHDQLSELSEMLLALGRTAASGPDEVGASSAPVSRPALPITAAAYDGDTPSPQRSRVRDTARIILSNPDMLHAGILPQHTRWAAFFASLRIVVIDEMHVYRGVFGSHVANVLRRLRRICRFYGSEPQFILASATIANPAELASRLVEAPVALIGPEQNGAPQGEAHVLFYNPPMLDASLGIRRSSNMEGADLATHFLAHGVQTIVFTRARLTAELTLAHIRDLAREGQSSLDAATIRGYRGGYLPAERREIERGLREGAVRCVVATSALELGIDIGQLDAALLIGYPGTIASARQQMGRAGRRQGPSVGLLVASAAALDQYLMTHPEYLLGNSPEHARLNPDNAVILSAHLACAAAELPLWEDEPFGAVPSLAGVLDDLVEAEQIYRGGGRYFWAGDQPPAAGISLRSASPDRVVIQAVGPQGGKPRTIGEMERSGIPLLLYQGAIYLHEGATYLVGRLDWDAGIASVRPVEVDFYTRPNIEERIEVMAERAATEYLPPRPVGESEAAPDAPAGIQVGWGDVRVVSRATGYRTFRRGTNELLGSSPIDLPEQALETQAFWLAFPDALIDSLRAEGRWYSDPNEYGPEWPAQRDAVRARDGYRCQGCGAPEIAGRAHDAHHKIPFRAFLADPGLRDGLPRERAWEAANRLENLVTLCSSCHHRAEASVRTRSGLGGVAALLAGVAPLHLMCDPNDLGILTDPQEAGSGLPTITLYERVPAGVGYAEQIYESLADLLEAALDLVANCPCESGCPSCVGPILEHQYMLETKALAKALLEKICVYPREERAVCG